MRIDYPLPDQMQQLKALWQEAFGDTEDYLDLFRSTGFAPARCRCVTEDGQVAAVLYWLDMFCHGQKFAYIYAVATAKASRGRGFCRMLMEDTHKVLRSRGYDGAVLSPAGEGLTRMYGSMGYSHCGSITQLRCEAGQNPAKIRKVDAAAYNAKRNSLLPEGGLELGRISVEFLAAQAELYAGEDFTLAAVRTEDGLFGIELLGDTENAPAILKALDCETGIFRISGGEDTFAMFHPLKETAKQPTYLGIAFD